MKRIAAIDIGSNSILLLIAEVQGRRLPRPIIGRKETPRLSAGMKETGIIGNDAVVSLLRSLKSFQRICENEGVVELRCYATSALRSASNSGEVLGRVKRETGFDINIISGRREAALTYLGAVTGLSNLNRYRLLVDAGGGSSEIVFADRRRIISSDSFLIGSVRLTEQFRSGRRLTESEMDRTLEAIGSEVSKLPLPDIRRPLTLICSGGTPTAIQGYRVGLDAYDPSRVHDATMRISEYKSLVYELGMMTLASRRRALRFEPKRADVITSGGLLTVAFAEQSGAGFVRISDRSLRFGMLCEMVGRAPEFA